MQLHRRRREGNTGSLITCYLSKDYNGNCGVQQKESLRKILHHHYTYTTLVTTTLYTYSAYCACTTHDYSTVVVSSVSWLILSKYWTIINYHQLSGILWTVLSLGLIFIGLLLTIYYYYSHYYLTYYILIILNTNI